MTARHDVARDLRRKKPFRSSARRTSRGTGQRVLRARRARTRPMWPSERTGRVGRELVRVPIRRHVVRHDVHARHLVLLLPLHTPILEPDLYLTFRKTESMRDLNATPPRQIAVEVKLFLQLQRLIPGVRGPLSLRLAVRVHRA